MQGSVLHLLLFMHESSCLSSFWIIAHLLLFLEINSFASLILCIADMLYKESVIEALPSISIRARLTDGHKHTYTVLTFPQTTIGIANVVNGERARTNDP